MATLTDDDARLIADVLWGTRGTPTVTPDAFGNGWLVSIEVTRNVHYEFHRLGRNGRPTCHDWCKALIPGGGGRDRG